MGNVIDLEGARRERRPVLSLWLGIGVESGRLEIHAEDGDVFLPDGEFGSYSREMTEALVREFALLLDMTPAQRQEYYDQGRGDRGGVE